ncbi:MAG: hypothetical protein ACOC9Y_08170 [Chloroflexota bacterium]
MTTGPSGEQVIQEMAEILEPHISGIISRINVDEFTTAEFIQALQMDPEAQRAFQDALDHWPETDERLSRLVLHGQVIPQLLRRSKLVEWAGYAHGEEDPYGVPAWWKKL